MTWSVLVEFGADVNARDTENWTPLHAAATCGHTNICRILLEKWARKLEWRTWIANRFLLFSGADILAVNADQSISFDICEERSECLFYLQNEMRRAGITQKDIDKARKSQEVNLIEHCKELRFVSLSFWSNWTWKKIMKYLQSNGQRSWWTLRSRRSHNTALCSGARLSWFDQVSTIEGCPGQ